MEASVHVPGSSPGTQTVTDTLTYNASTLRLDLWTNEAGVPGTDFDQIVMDGAAPVLTLSYDPTIEINLYNANTLTWQNPDVGRAYVVITGFSTRDGTFASVNVDAGATDFLNAGKSFRIDYNANNITLTVIPEPGTMGVVAAFLAMSLMNLRRFKK